MPEPDAAALAALTLTLPLGATPSLVARVQRVVSRELLNSALRPCVVCGCDGRDGLECDPPPPQRHRPPQPPLLAVLEAVREQVAGNAVNAAAIAGVASVAGAALVVSLPAAALCAGALAIGRAVWAGWPAQQQQPEQPEQPLPPPPQPEPEPEVPALPLLPRHFVCADCLHAYALHACTPGEGGGVVLQTGELLPPCAAGAAAFLPPAPAPEAGIYLGERAAGQPHRPCPAPAVCRRALAAALRDDSFSAFERARDSWVQARAAAEALAVASARVAAEAAASAVQRHVTHISEAILTPKCPACSAAFVDFEGCFALACGRRECETRFCGWCLRGFGRDSQAAHRHVTECDASRARGSFYGTPQQFAAALRDRAVAAIPRYLDEAVGRRGQGARASRERDEIIRRLEPVLTLHGIRARSVR